MTNKSQLWIKVREQLLQHLAVSLDNWGFCETKGCNDTFGIGFAHRMKRRKFPSFKKQPEAHEEELKQAAYLCVKCHLKLEHGDPDEMYDTITAIIEAR